MTQDKPTIEEALQDFKAKYPTVSSADLQTFIIGYNAASLNRQGCGGEDYKLAPEETELIDVWRQARAAVKNSKFSIADERLEHCKRILGDSNDY